MGVSCTEVTEPYEVYAEHKKLLRVPGGFLKKMEPGVVIL